MRAKTGTKTVTFVEITDQVNARIKDATKGLTPSYSRRLSLCGTKQISVICDYISALRSEIKLSDGYRQTILTTLLSLSRTSKKEFRDFTRADVITFLNHFRKEDLQCESDQYYQIFQVVIQS
jgi:hypothetical protein